MFGWLVKKWADLPELKTTVENPDIIAPLGYGVLSNNRLPLATAGNLEKAVLARKRFPRALIVFGNSSHCFKGSDIVESKRKRLWLASEDANWSYLDVGPIINTVIEAERIKSALNGKKIYPTEIVLITGQMHARYAVLVWKRTFPGAKIALAVTPYYNEYESGHIIKLQRSKYILFPVRIVQYVLARFFGLGFFRKIQHPVTKTV